MDFVVGLPGFESSFILTSYVTLAKILNLSVAHLQIRVMVPHGAAKRFVSHEASGAVAVVEWILEPPWHRPLNQLCDFGQVTNILDSHSLSIKRR